MSNRITKSTKERLKAEMSEYFGFPMPSLPGNIELPAENSKYEQIISPRHTIFIFNIHFTTTSDEMRAFALQYGEIMSLNCDIDRKGHSYVTYFDLRSAEKAIESANGIEMRGRIIGATYMIYPQNRRNNLNIPVSSCIQARATNLSTYLTETEVVDTLKQFGDIRSIKSTNVGKFIVKFEDIRSARSAAAQSRNATTRNGTTLDLAIYNEEERIIIERILIVCD